MARDDQEPEVKRPAAPSVPGLYGAERESEWVDPEDLADRAAYEQERRSQLRERPPHY